MSARAGLLLDRDGTLIDMVRDEETGLITTAFHPSQLRLLPGVVDALIRARDAGYVLAIATNQPGPAKGHFSSVAVDRTNEALSAMLRGHGIELAAIESCMHHPEGADGGDPTLIGPCDCRKPLPGLLLRLIDHLGLDRASSWMLGDTPTDVRAGRAAGVRTGLIFSPGRCELCPFAHGPTEHPDLSAPTLRELIDLVLSRATS